MRGKLFEDARRKKDCRAESSERCGRGEEMEKVLKEM